VKESEGMNEATNGKIRKYREKARKGMKQEEHTSKKKG
jgi:hypothetical protein